MSHPPPPENDDRRPWEEAPAADLSPVVKAHTDGTPVVKALDVAADRWAARQLGRELGLRHVLDALAELVDELGGAV